MTRYSQDFGEPYQCGSMTKTAPWLQRAAQFMALRDQAIFPAAAQLAASTAKWLTIRTREQVWRSRNRRPTAALCFHLVAGGPVPFAGAKREIAVCLTPHEGFVRVLVRADATERWQWVAALSLGELGQSQVRVTLAGLAAEMIDFGEESSSDV